MTARNNHPRLTKIASHPVGMITMRKVIHGFLFLCYMGMVLHLLALWVPEALLLLLKEG